MTFPNVASWNRTSLSMYKKAKCIYGFSAMYDMEKSHIPISNGHVHKGKFDATLNSINRISGIENELSQVDKNLINLQRNKTSHYAENISSTAKTNVSEEPTITITEAKKDSSDNESTNSSPTLDRQNTSSPNIIVDRKKTVEQIQNQLFSKSNIKRTSSLGQKPTYKKQSSLVSNCLNKFENGIQETEPSPGENRQCSTLPRKWKTNTGAFVGKVSQVKPVEAINEKQDDVQSNNDKVTNISKIPVVNQVKKQNGVCNNHDINNNDEKGKVNFQPKPQLVRRNTVDTPSHNLHERLTKASAPKGLLSLSLDITECKPFSLQIPSTKISTTSNDTTGDPPVEDENKSPESTTRRKLERSQSLTKFTPICPKTFKEISFLMKKPNDPGEKHSLILNGVNGNESNHVQKRSSCSELSNNIEIHLNGTKCKVNDNDSENKSHENGETITEDDFRNTSFIASMQSAKECRQRRRRASLEPSNQFSDATSSHATIEEGTQPIDICTQTRNHRRRPCSTGSMDKILEVEENEDEATLARKMKTGSLEINNLSLRERKRKDAVNDDSTRIAYDVCRGSFDSPDSLRKTIQSNEKRVPESPRYSNRDSYDLKLRAEQDLGSAENVQSNCESPVNKVDSSASFKKKIQDRRGSAPATLYKRRSQKIIAYDENGIEQRRRNSSVEEKLNRVRFDLEKSFEKEEKIFKQKMEIEVQTHEIFNSKEFKIIDNSSKCDERRASQKNRKCSVVDLPFDEEDDNNNKVLRQRKFSLPEQHFVPAFRPDHDKLKPIDESRPKDLFLGRKLSIPDVVFSSPLTRRKNKKLEKKESSFEEEAPTVKKQSERKTSITDTIRSVVGSKNKSERKVSSTSRTLPVIAAEVDLNGLCDKKSKWNSIKDRIRNTTTDMISSPKSSPRLPKGSIHRHDSTSSAEGLTPRLRKKFYNRGSWNRGSGEYDTLSIDSFCTDKDSPDVDVAKLFRRQPFELWSEGKICIDLENPSLPLVHVASAEGNMKLLETLADIGVDLNEEDHNGWSALHYAICSGHFESAKFLLERGANITSYTNKVMNNYCKTVRDVIRSNSFGVRR